MALNDSDLPKLVELLNLIDLRFKVRRRTAAEWTTLNEILLDGEWGKETDTGKMKQGDGSTAWNSLDYFSSGTALGPSNAGSNISIDVTNPDVPVISSTLGAIELKGRVPDYASLPPSGNTAGDAYANDEDKLIYVWDGSSWPADGEGLALGGSEALIPINIASNVLTIDAALGSYFGVTMNQNINSVVLNNSSGYRRLTIQFTQGATVYSAHWPSNWSWASTVRVLPTTPSAAVVLVLTTYNGGDSWSASIDTASSPNYPTSDPNWSSVVALLHFDGDLADATGRHTWGVGTDNYSAEDAWGGGYSLKGAGSPIREAATSADWQFGTGAFTVEAWIKVTGTLSRNSYGVMGTWVSSVGWGLFVMVSPARGLQWYAGSASPNIKSGSAVIPQNTWTHVAYSRSGTTGRLFVNGTQVASGTDSTNYSSSNPPKIGGNGTTTDNFIGFLDEVRVTKGVARYTAAFTPPAFPFPNS